MGLTRFPHGVFATPNLGGVGRLSDIWNTGNIWFVNGDVSASGTGLAPEQAVKTISEAISLASKGGTIYVKPLTTTSSTQTYYQDNLTIPLTKPNLSIIGAGYYGAVNSFSGCQLKLSTITDHLIKVRGAGFNIENMRLAMPNGTGDIGTSIISAYHATTTAPAGDDGTEKKPTGLTIRGCQFASTTSAASATYNLMGAALGLASVSQLLVEDCIFYGCHTGIMLTNSSGVGNNQVIRNNIFSGVPTSRQADIVNIGNGTGIVIAHNIFADGVPSKSGGSYGTNFIYMNAGTGIVAWNSFASSEDGEIVKATGTDSCIPTTFFAAGNVYEGAATEGDGFCRRT
jgi:hypothetical protein